MRLREAEAGRVERGCGIRYLHVRVLAPSVGRGRGVGAAAGDGQLMLCNARVCLDGLECVTRGSPGMAGRMGPYDDGDMNVTTVPRTEGDDAVNSKRAAEQRYDGRRGTGDARGAGGGMDEGAIYFSVPVPSCVAMQLRGQVSKLASRF